MFKKETIKNFSKPTKIRVAFLFLIVFFISIPFIYILSVKFYNKVCLDSITPSYEKKEETNFSEVCKKIQNSQVKELCFSVTENKDFDKEKAASALKEELKIDLKRTCGLFEFGSAPYCFSKQKIEKIISGEINSIPSQIYFQAITENPYFCDKIPLDILEFNDLSLQRRECYLDMAIIWKDDSLCEKLKKYERDFCYLMLVIQNYK